MSILSGAGQAGQAIGGGAGGVSNPLGWAMMGAQSLGGILGAVANPFDFGGQYTMDEAKAQGAAKGKAIAGGIPLLGDLFGMIGAKIAERRAAPVLENREAKMQSALDYQKEKLRNIPFYQDANIGESWGMGY